MPEEDPYTPSFDQCGYQSNLLIANASKSVWMYTIYFTLMILSTSLVWVCNRVCKGRCEHKKKKLISYFFWNSLIRLTMESAFELTLVAVLNLRTMDPNSTFPAVRYSNALSVIYLSFVSVLLCSLVALYCLNFKKLKDKEF